MFILEISVFNLLLLFFILFVFSAFFSGSETALTTINRYRLMSLSRQGNKRAKIILELLKKPESLITMILLGNNLVNILIAQLSAFMGYRLYGDIGVVIAASLLTFLMLIFAELTPKTIAFLHPHHLGMFSGVVYYLLRIPLFPVIWLVNGINLLILKMLRLDSSNRPHACSHTLNRDELRHAVSASSNVILQDYSNMLVGVLDLESKTVEDIMTTRGDIYTVNIRDNWPDARRKLLAANYTRVPLCDGKVDEIIGIVHMRHVIQLMEDQEFDLESLMEVMREPCYVSECMPLYQALKIFKKKRQDLALVVNEWGDIKGLVTIEDLLEEIVGDFTGDPSTYDIPIVKNKDGSITVDGSCHVREINQATAWGLDVDGPKTVNGYILEYLEEIPSSPLCVLLNGFRFEVMKTDGTAIRVVRITPHSEG